MVQLAYAKFLEFPRAVRYLFVGGASIVVQMVTLALLVNLFRLDSNSERFFANAVAFFVSVQFNFAISRTLTWYDRIDGRNRMFSQWAAFNGTNVLILIINQIVFAEVVQFLPYLIASGLAVIIGTVFNYTVSYTLIFRKKSTKRDPTFLQPIFNLHRDFDLTEIYLVLIAFLFIGLASYYYVTHELTLTYADAQSHLMIARRVIDNTSGQTDFAQLGGVWLPLTHIWSLPLVSINELYNTGLAGTYISIFSYFLGAIYTYRLAKTITNHQIAGVAAALIFITNPNILYMASTAMTELPLYFTTTASIFYLTKFSQEPDNRTWLFWAGLTIALSTGIRYEAWVILALEFLVVVYIYMRQKMPLVKIQSRFIWFGMVAAAMVVGWLIWNLTIFGNPLEFQTGSYAKPALWVSFTDPVIKNLPLSLNVYYQATISTVGPVFFLGLIGLIIYLVTNRIKPDKVAPLALVSIFPFYVANLYLGQRPLKVPALNNGEIYNIRFGLFMIIPVAVFAAYLLSRLDLKPWRNFVLIAMVLTGASTFLTEPITLMEGVLQSESPMRVAEVHASNWMKHCYDTGTIIGENYGNESFVFASQIDLGKYIYEGSYQVRDPAYRFPWEFGEWVFMHGSDQKLGVVADTLWNLQHDDKIFMANFRRVYQNGVFEIWRKIHLPDLKAECSNPTQSF